MTPIPTLLVQTVVIVAVARATGSLFRRIGQPRVVGEMVAGILLGPSLLGRVAPDVAAFLFAKSSLDTLSTFSQFGLVLFMFLVGIELDSAHTRGLIELVVLNIGLESGILPSPLFAMLMMMALITTAMTSPLLRRLGYPNGGPA